MLKDSSEKKGVNGMETPTAMATTLTICPSCGEKAYHRVKKPLTAIYKGHTLVVEQPSFWCNHCGQNTTLREGYKAAQKSLQSLKAHIDGLLAPNEIYRIRHKILGLTQKKAADFFGGGPNAFSRYENGQVSPPLAVSNLLRILARHPEYLREIRPHKKRK